MGKKIFFSIVLAGAGLSMFISCGKDTVSNPRTSIVSLYNCDNVESSDRNYAICFDSSYDSRCPTGAVCVWGGIAIIKVSFHEHNNTHRFKMALTPFNRPGLIRDTTINGYKIVFTDLQPFPNNSVPSPPPSEIKATIEISN